ncbi:MAG: two-component regulator propeller domain-containing protein [Bacteroidia bacterium]
MRLTVWIIFVSLAASPWALTQAQGFKIRHFSLVDGMSQSSVHCLLQDQQGLIWIGTEDGLNRFDGYEFAVLKKVDNQSSLPHNWVNCLYQDRQNFIWVGTKNGVSRLDPSTYQWIHCPIPWEYRDKTVLSFLQDEQGRLWITTQTGIFRLENTEAKPDDWEIVELKMIYPNLPKETPHKSLKTPSGQLYFCFSNQRGENIYGSIYRYDPLTDAFTKLALPEGANPADRGVEELSLQSDSILCYGTILSGFRRLNLNTNQILTSPDQAAIHPFVRSLYTDRNEGIWAGTYEQLAYFAPGADSIQIIQTPEATGPVECILESKEGHIWFGSAQGLYQLRLNQNKFETFSVGKSGPNALVAADIFGIKETRKGEFWGVAYDYGLIRLIPDGQGGWHQYAYPAEELGLKTAQNLDLQEDSKGDLWLGGFGGLVRLRIPSYQDPRNAPPPEVKIWSASADGIKTPYITDVLPDPDGSYWLADYTAGLEHIQIVDDQLSVVRRYSAAKDDPYSLLDNRAASIQFDQKGRFWLSSKLGLSRGYFNSEGQIAFRHLLLPPIDSAFLKGQAVKMFHQDSAGIFWLASEGLYRVELMPGAEQSPWQEGVSPYLPIRWEHFGVADGLTNEVIYGILGDANGDLWLSHNEGLDRFDPETGSFRNYRAEDGLQSNEFSANAFAYGKDGYLYFGGIEGFSRFHPDSVRDADHVPRAMISELSLYNQKVKVGQKIPQSPTILSESITYTQQLNLSWRDYVVGFDFVGIGYGDTERYQYAYQMQGLDEDWQYVGQRRFVTYTNLDPGDYLFKLKAANEDGIWQQEPTTLRIHVSTPPWRTLWAYLLYALILAALIYAFIRYRTRKVRLEMLTQRRIEQARLAEREKVRARSSRDFHDESGNKITKISLYTGLLRQGLDPSSDMESMLDKIDENVKALSGGMRDFIWALDPKKDRLTDTAQRLQEFGEQLFEDSGINFRFHSKVDSAQDYRLDLNIRRQLLLIFKEAMNNCLKYAQASEVQLRLSESGDRLDFAFHDNGMGFDLNQLQRVNGLNNMQHRVKEMGAKIEIKSVPGIGTQITVQVPKQVLNHPNG